MSFLHKRVREDGGRFGSDLRDLRELHGISLEQAAHDTKIRGPILQAFEEEQLGSLGDLVFAERHLLAYVRYLGGHETYFLARYRERLTSLNAERRVSDLLPRVRGVRRMDFFVGPQIFGIVSVLLFGLLLGGYVLWQAHLVNTPPPLLVDSPIDGQKLELPTVVIRGKTMPEAYVTVNGVDAPVNGDGAFSLPLDVRRGTSVITIIAHRRKGSETMVERRVMYESPLMDVSATDTFGATSSSATSTY